MSPFTLLDGLNILSDLSRRLWAMEVKEERLARNELVKILNGFWILSNLLRTSVVPFLQSRTDFICIRNK